MRTVDGMSPNVRYAGYAAYTLAGPIVGIARAIAAIWALVMHKLDKFGIEETQRQTQADRAQEANKGNWFQKTFKKFDNGIENAIDRLENSPEITKINEKMDKARSQLKRACIEMIPLFGAAYYTYNEATKYVGKGAVSFLDASRVDEILMSVSD
jgi:hypothetical protein